MNLWPWRRKKDPKDDRLREATQRVVSLEARAADLIHGGRFTEDHLTKIFREGRRNA